LSGASFPVPDARSAWWRRASAAVLGLALLAGTALPAAAGIIPVGNPQDATPARATPEVSRIVAVEEAIPYREVDGVELALDACRPAGSGNAPVAAIVLVHGGSWITGTRDADYWRQVCEATAEAGFAGFAISYRLAPEYTYPAAVEDVAAAVEWLREPAQVDRFGIDPARVGIIGESAGGHLGALVGVTGEGDWTTGSRVSAVASLAGPMDLTSDALAYVSPLQARVALGFLGCDDIEDCPQTVAASPVRQVDPTDPPFLIMHAEDDPIVPVEQSEVMAAELEEAGVEHELIIVPGSEHASAMLIDDALLADLFTFMAEELAL
jgi:acetyl esterase/lipase